MQPIRTLIVDDEQVARRGVRALLDDHHDFEVVGEARNGEEAIVLLRSLRPDAVFLDVQMPGKDGFAVVSALATEEMPVIVFLTAYDDHALRAFDAQALDYLLKPVRDERFAESLERIRRQVRQRRLGGATDQLRAALDAIASPEPQPARYLNRLALRDSDEVSFLPVDQLEWIEAADYFTRAHTATRAHLLRETLQELETRLDPSRFVRVHRSAIVNIESIVRVVTLSRSHHELVLRSGARVPLSRRRRSELEAALGHPL